MLKVTMLGQFDVRLNDEPVSLTSRPLQLLLAYLMLNAGKVQPRAKIAGILWPDSLESTARKNLRNYVWQLRKAIGDDYLETSKTTVAFGLSRPYQFDVQILRREGDNADELIDIASVYKGELLPGHYENWIQLERERVRAIFERRLQALLNHLEEKGRWSELVSWSEHWLSFGQSPEPAYRALMTGYAGLGDLAGVEMSYRRCKKDFEEELGINLSAETRLLFESLLVGKLPVIEIPDTRENEEFEIPPPTIGRLVLTGDSGQTFQLEKSSITLGRQSINDIVLEGANVSRSHARLDYEQDQFVLVDLNSANGVTVNGQGVNKQELEPGDLIGIGDYVFRFETDQSTFSQADSQDEALTVINSLEELGDTLTNTSLGMTLTNVQIPRLAVHTATGTWEFPLRDGGATIGRSNENDVVIPFPKVSRHHAVVERAGNGFVVRDLGSSNGTSLNGHPIERERVPNGGTIQIGDALLIFKEGFQPQDLTLVELGDDSDTRNRKPVVVIPGLMGSQLWLGSERIWPNVRAAFSSPDLFKLDPSGETNLEAQGLVDEVVIVPNLIKQAQYNRLGDFLVDSLGYERGRDLLEFAYDWRQDVRLSAAKLAAAIKDWEEKGIRGPVTIIAHSLGTLVSRYYINCLGGDKKVNRILLLGGPHQGTPRAFTSLFEGARLLPFGWMGERLRDIMRTFHSSYQYLPFYSCILHDGTVSQTIDLFSQPDWLDEDFHSLLRYGREFQQEVGLTLKVPSVSIFGYGQKTLTGVRVSKNAETEWQGIDLVIDKKGDETVPEFSAILPGSEIHPVQQNHGSLYIDNDVRMRIRIELTRS